MRTGNFFFKNNEEVTSLANEGFIRRSDIIVLIENKTLAIN